MKPYSKGRAPFFLLHIKECVGRCACGLRVYSHDFIYVAFDFFLGVRGFFNFYVAVCNNGFGKVISRKGGVKTFGKVAFHCLGGV